jgi:hypothetical protein
MISFKTWMLGHFTPRFKSMKIGQLVKVVDEINDEEVIIRHHLHGQIGIIVQRTMSSHGFEPNWYDVLFGEKIHTIHCLDLDEITGD